jgi:hypothetical protein
MEFKITLYFTKPFPARPKIEQHTRSPFSATRPWLTLLFSSPIGRLSRAAGDSFLHGRSPSCSSSPARQGNKPLLCCSLVVPLLFPLAIAALGPSSSQQAGAEPRCSDKLPCVAASRQATVLASKPARVHRRRRLRSSRWTPGSSGSRRQAPPRFPSLVRW